jgi:antirestriction protein ArdC
VEQENLILYYNRLNGHSISLDKLKNFRERIQTSLDSNGHGSYTVDLKGMLSRVTGAIKKMIAEGAEVADRIEMIPIEIKKHNGKILRVASGYQEKETIKTVTVKDASVVAELIELSKIHTDTKRFQNRMDAFSEASANSVAENYDPNKFDPIVVWEDPKAKKIFVLSGHSRYEGMKRRGAKTIPVRYFNGSEEEAIRFAKVEANRAANQESLIEDLGAYRLMRDGDESKGIKKLSKADLAKIFKGKVQKLDAYSFLSGGGLFVNALNQGTTSNYPYLERNAQWIGQLRKENTVISNGGEDNIFHFFYSDKTGRNLKLSKDEFFKLAARKIGQLGRGEGVLFPECSAEGCVKIADKESDPIKGETFRRLREITEQITSIREKLSSKDPRVRVTTDEEKKYLRTTAERLEAEKEKIQRDLDVMDKSQSSLFGLPKHKKLTLDEQRQYNYAKQLGKEAFLAGKKSTGYHDKALNDFITEELGAGWGKVGESIHLWSGWNDGWHQANREHPHLYGIECGCPDGEETGLGFTRDGQKKIYDMITDMILKIMKEGKGLPWQKPWAIKSIIATNFVSKKPYKGANLFLLNLIAPMFEGKVGPYWMTYKQAKQMGGQVKEGAKGFPVIYYAKYYTVSRPKKQTLTEEQFNAMTSAERIERGAFETFTINYYTVFAQEDIDGIEFPVHGTKRSDASPIEAAQAIVDGMPNPPEIIHHSLGRAYYSPMDDHIKLPAIEYFKQDQQYYSTLFHEMIHSTGHEKRLNRFTVNKEDAEGKDDYAFEELIAEMGASYLNAEAGTLYFTMKNAATYLKSWQTKLEDLMESDNKFFLKASGKAAQAAEFILDRKEEVQADPVKEEPLSYVNDIDKETAYRAYTWTSFSPEKRGEGFRQEYSQTLLDFREKIKPMADKVGKSDEFETDFTHYRKKMKDLATAYLRSHSNVASAMITGPSKFPVERNRKKGDIADNKLKEYFSYDEYKRKTLIQKYTPDEFKPVKTGQDNALEILQKKLANLERAHKIMVDANKVIRTKKSEAEKIAALQEVGLTEKQAREILQPDFAGRIGFAAYNLSNSSAEIKRLKDRIAEVETLHAKRETGNKITKYAGGEVVENYDEDRLQLIFDGKPDEAIRTILKKHGFKWSPKNTAWQRQLTSNARWVLKQIIGQIFTGQPQVEGPQVDAFTDVRVVPKQKGPLNRLQMQQLEDAIKAGRTPKVNLKAKLNAKIKPAPLFDEPVNNPRQASLFGAGKKGKKKGKKHLGFVTADQAPKAPGKIFTLPGTMGKLLGNLQAYKLEIVVAGETHSGKSELGKQLADAFAGAGHKVAYIDWEQGGMESRDTLDSMVRNVEAANRKRVHVTGDLRRDLDAVKSLASQFPVIVLDSGTKLNEVTNAWIDSLREEYPQTIWIPLMQQNAKGGTRGGTSAEFDAPVVIKTYRPDEKDFRKNYAYVFKNRGNATGLYYNISEKKIISDPTI